MEEQFIYLIKASGLISLFYLAYLLLLRKETFFTANRWFLLLGLITSAVLPLFFLTKIIWIEPTVNSFDWSEMPITTNVITNPEPEIDWYQIIAYVYLTGIAVLLFKLIFDFKSLSRILKGKTIQKEENFKMIDVSENIAPFSYFRFIVYNSSLYSGAELENIVEHEKVHSRQYHTVDVLFSRLFCIAFWFNPFVWLYKKAIIQNLEFIADREAAKYTSDKKAYQFTLLKITTQENCVAITNHFYQPLIKKRIIMLNKNQSKKWNSFKYALVIPALIAFVFLYQIKVVAQEKETNKVEIKAVKNDIFNLIITKNTTEKEIKQQCEKVKKMYGIDLRFFNIKRNSKGEIISIESEYKDKDSGGGSAIAHEPDNKPIKPFKFFHDNNSKTNGYNMDLTSELKGNNGVKPTEDKPSQLDKKNNNKAKVDRSENTEEVTTSNKINTQNEKRIIIVDGMQVAGDFKIEDIPSDQIGSINELNPKAAVEKYGEDAKEGAIEIFTKRFLANKTVEKPMIIINGKKA